VVNREPLIVLMPAGHRLATGESVRPDDLLGETFIGGANMAAVLRAVTDDYLRRSGSTSSPITGWTTPRWPSPWSHPPRLALMPAYASNLLPHSVVSRPLEGQPPTIDVAVSYSKSNTPPILKLFLARLHELAEPNHKLLPGWEHCDVSQQSVPSSW
jgi:LysR family transcriptional regulator, hca operon transcriptional activator